MIDYEVSKVLLIFVRECYIIEPDIWGKEKIESEWWIVKERASCY